MCDRGSLRDEDEPVPHYRIPESIVPRVLDLMHALGRENFNTMTTMDRLLFAKGMTPFKPDAFYVDGMTSPAQLTFGWMQHHGQWMHVTDPQWTDIRPGLEPLMAALELWQYRTGCGALIGTGASGPGHNSPIIRIK